MITAVDTSVLLDVFADDPVHRPASYAALKESVARGGLIACSIVWAEVAAQFPDAAAAKASIEGFHITFDDLDRSIALDAGQLWRRSRVRGGGRARLIPDFLIGAHAQVRADRLLTRDRGFYRTYFPKLKIVDPSA